MLQVVDELLRDKSSHLVLQLHDRHAAAARFMRRGFEACDQRMLLEEFGDGASQLARAVPVNDTQDSVDP